MPVLVASGPALAVSRRATPYFLEHDMTDDSNPGAIAVRAGNRRRPGVFRRPRPSAADPLAMIHTLGVLPRDAACHAEAVA